MGWESLNNKPGSRGARHEVRQPKTPRARGRAEAIFSIAWWMLAYDRPVTPNAKLTDDEERANDARSGTCG